MSDKTVDELLDMHVEKNSYTIRTQYRVHTENDNRFTVTFWGPENSPQIRIRDIDTGRELIVQRAACRGLIDVLQRALDDYDN